MWLPTAWAILKAGLLGAGCVLIVRATSVLDQRCFERILIAFALALRLAWLFAYPMAPQGDAALNHRIATALAAGEGFSVDDRPTALRPPGFVFLLAGVYFVGGPDPILGSLVNVVLGVLVIWFGMRLASHMFGTAAGRIAGILLALWPSSVPLAGELLAEPLFEATLLGAILLTIRQDSERHERRNAWGSAFVVSVSGLTKGAGFLPLVLLALWARRDRRGAVWLRWVLPSVVLLACLTTAWLIRHKLVLGEFVPVTTHSGLTLWHGNNPLATGFPSDALRVPCPDEGGEIEQDRCARAEAWAFVREHPRRAATLFLTRVARSTESDAEQLGAAAAAHGPTPVLALVLRLASSHFNSVVLLFIGWLLLLGLGGRRPDAREAGDAALLVSTVGLIVLVHALFVAQYRYAFMWLPFVVIGVSALLARWATKDHEQLAERAART